MAFEQAAPGTVIKSATYNNNLANTAHLSDQQKVLNKVMSGVLVTDTDGSTVTFDMSSAGGNLHQVTLGGNRTLAVSGVAVGQAFLVTLIQDGTGNRTVSWFAGISWQNGVTPVLTTTASKKDVFAFVCIATDTYLGFVVGQNL